MRKLVLLITLLSVSVFSSAQSYNWDAGKVTWVSPLVAYGTGIIQYNAAICNGRMVPGEFVIYLDPHISGQPNYGTYTGSWVGSSTGGPTYTRVYLSDGTSVVLITGELMGTYTSPGTKDRKKIEALLGVKLPKTAVTNVHAWFSDTIADTQFANNYALGCGGVNIIFAPNG